MESNNPGISGETSFVLALYSSPPNIFSFSDILRFKITFTVDPEGKLPNGKGDMPSMIVAYPNCIPNIWNSIEMCGPFKGMYISLQYFF